MTDSHKKLTVSDLDPTRPPDHGVTNLYSSSAGHLISHGPDGVLLETAEGASAQTSPDGTVEVDMPRGSKFVFADTAILTGYEERRSGSITTITLHFEGGGSLAVMSDDARTRCEICSHQLHIVVSSDFKTTTIMGTTAD